MEPTTTTQHQPSSSFTVTRHYYYHRADWGDTSELSQRMEQSLDVYEPTPTTSTTPSPRPTIVLVTGSGWLGCHPWIYTVTNWWNSSGAIAMAKLGYRCILVRHRGAFFQIPEPNSYVCFLGSFGIMLIYLFMSKDFLMSLSQPGFWISVYIVLSSHLFLLFVLKWSDLWCLAKGAATFHDMHDDVQHALEYIRADLHETQIILAGYSSGAHVVAMMLDPQMSTWTNLPKIVGILYISGVLSLDSSFMNLITLSVFGKWACDIPSPYTSPLNRTKRGIFPQTTTQTTTFHLPIDFITLSFFGKWPFRLPLPFGRTRESTSVFTTYTDEMRVAQPLPPFSLPPHLFIGCRHEIFGIPLLDATFCSQEYSDSMKKHDICPTKCLLLESTPRIRMNHWTILSSPQFSQALDEHLPWLWDPTTTLAASPPSTPGGNAGTETTNS